MNRRGRPFRTTASSFAYGDNRNPFVPEAPVELFQEESQLLFRGQSLP